MPIGPNLNTFIGAPKGEGRPGAQAADGSNPFTGATTFPFAALNMAAGAAAPVTLAAAGLSPAAPAAPMQPLTSVQIPAAGVTALTGRLATLQPNLQLLRPDLQVFRPGIFTGLPKTTTQLARGAIKQLQEANATVLNEAINTIRNRNVAPGGLMNYLQRRVKIGEVLNELAKDWEADTKQDFAEAFNMDVNRLDIMDAIVALAILNDPDLEDEIRDENMSGTSEADLLQNRTVVWQHPPPGTPLDPPYLVLVAVAHRDTAQADQVVNSILAELVEHQGFKLPGSAAQKLR